VQVEEIYNYLKLSEAIATAGQPTPEQFTAIRDTGYQLVINLAMPNSPKALPNEREIVEGLGLRYIHIPVEWENPSLQDALDFFATMQANTDQRIFIHCIANMRVSAFMYLYRVLYSDSPEQELKQQLHRLWHPNETWQRFLDQVIETFSR
jgi:protein tyrosine phosphatase (PTP) superfamily phosphohydrolase (DUF442 family)